MVTKSKELYKHEKRRDSFDHELYIFFSKDTLMTVPVFLHGIAL